MISTDRRGQARVIVPSGVYSVEAPAGGVFPRLATVTVNGRPVPRTATGVYSIHLVAGSIRLGLTFDTGIR